MITKLFIFKKNILSKDNKRRCNTYMMSSYVPLFLPDMSLFSSFKYTLYLSVSINVKTIICMTKVSNIVIYPNNLNPSLEQH